MSTYTRYLREQREITLHGDSEIQEASPAPSTAEAKHMKRALGDLVSKIRELKKIHGKLPFSHELDSAIDNLEMTILPKIEKMVVGYSQEAERWEKGEKIARRKRGAEKRAKTGLRGTSTSRWDY